MSCDISDENDMGNPTGEVFLMRRDLLKYVAMVTLCVFLVTGSSAYAAPWGKLKNAEKLKNYRSEKARTTLQDREGLKFDDCEEFGWALGYIARLRGLGIIEGYGKNMFGPKDPVKQGQALAMIARALGLEEEAKELAAQFEGLYSQKDEKEDQEDGGYILAPGGKKLPKVPAPAFWSLGYVLLAVEKGWVQISEVSPEKPATRLWIAMVMVRACGYEEEAQGLMNVTLPFKDASSIPADKVGYVAQAVELGLFEGYEDGTFRPDKPVIRAELAAIIDRFLGDDSVEEAIDYYVKGHVVSVGSDSITVKTQTSQTVTYRVSPEALIIVNRQPAKLGDVHPGDQAVILSNGRGAALMIKVITAERSEIQERVGQIVSVSQGSDGLVRVTLKFTNNETVTMTVRATCRIMFGTALLHPDEIRAGDRVIARIQDQELVELKITSRASGA